MRAPVVTTMVLVGLASAAHADEPSESAPDRRLAVGGGLFVGMDWKDSAWVAAGAAVEATYRLSADGPLYLRGRLAVGETGPFAAESGPPQTGPLVEPMVGIEARGCVDDDRMFCVLAGAIVGYEYQHVDADDHDGGATTRGPFAGGTVGVDVGGDRYRFRAVFDLFERDTYDTFSDGHPRQIGGDVSIGIAHLF
jgi:hypothetical protein